jgi:multidrug transporter EmrE-like cation transporter
MVKLDNVKWIVISSIVSALYFFLIKEFVHSKKTHILSIVIALQMLIIYLYYQSLKTMNSGILFAIINGLSVIFGVIIANLYFKEIFTKFDMFGILLIVSGIMIVNSK